MPASPPSLPTVSSCGDVLEPQPKPNISSSRSFTELEKRQTQELQHGRLAMLATMELLRHDSQNLVSPGFDGLDNLITGLPFLY